MLTKSLQRFVRLSQKHLFLNKRVTHQLTRYFSNTHPKTQKKVVRLAKNVNDSITPELPLDKITPLLTEHSEGRILMFRAIYFYFNLNHYRKSFPLLFLIGVSVLLKFVYDGYGFFDKGSYQNNPIIEHIITLIQSSPFYPYIVGSDVNNGTPYPLRFVKAHRPIPDITQGLTKPCTIILEFSAGLRTFEVTCNLTSLPNNHDSEGNFLPYGTNPRHANSKSIYIKNLSIIEPESESGFAIRFADDPNDKWTQVQTNAYRNYVRSLDATQQLHHLALNANVDFAEHPDTVNAQFHSQLAQRDTIQINNLASPVTRPLQSLTVRPSSKTLNSDNLSILTSQPQEPYKPPRTIIEHIGYFLPEVIAPLIFDETESFDAPPPYMFRDHAFPVDVSPYGIPIRPMEHASPLALTYPMITTTSVLNGQFEDPIKNEEGGMGYVSRLYAEIPLDQANFGNDVMTIRNIQHNLQTEPKVSYKIPEFSMSLYNNNDNSYAAVEYMKETYRKYTDRNVTVSSSKSLDPVIFLPRLGNSSFYSHLNRIQLKSLPCAQWYPIQRKTDPLVPAPATPETLKLEQQIRSHVYKKLRSSDPYFNLRLRKHQEKARVNETRMSPEDVLYSYLQIFFLETKNRNASALTSYENYTVTMNGDIFKDKIKVGSLCYPMGAAFKTNSDLDNAVNEYKISSFSIDRNTIHTDESTFIAKPAISPFKYAFQSTVLFFFAFTLCTYIPMASLHNITKANPTVIRKLNFSKPRFFFIDPKSFWNRNPRVTLFYKDNYKIVYELMRSRTQRVWNVSNVQLVNDKLKFSTDIPLSLTDIPRHQSVPFTLENEDEFMKAYLEEITNYVSNKQTDKSKDQ